VPRNYKIAIIGAGPSGYFAAQALQNSVTEDLTFSIDMIERLLHKLWITLDLYMIRVEIQGAQKRKFVQLT